ncbi:MAG: hypothetical protein U0232_09780 [Thermomicrobiales bacterium]
MGTIEVPRPMREVRAAAAAKMVTASGAGPPTVDQTLETPWAPALDGGDGVAG